jgi:phosphoserine phosphatase RsbU/P
MPVPLAVQRVYRRLGNVEKIFLSLVALYFVVMAAAPRSGWFLLVELLCVFFGAWIAVRLIRAASRRIIWRLRNRLLVTYLFIAVVPVVLIATLAGVVGWIITSQVAVYLVTSELDRRLDTLHGAANSLARVFIPGEFPRGILSMHFHPLHPARGHPPHFVLPVPPAPTLADRTSNFRRLADVVYNSRFPGFEAILSTPSDTVRYPETSSLAAPPAGWRDTTGVVLKDGRFYGWCHRSLPSGGDVTVLAPLTSDYLADLVPNLGAVDIVYLGPSATIADQTPLATHPHAESGMKGQVPPPVNRFDVVVPWTSLISVARWDMPDQDGNALLTVRTRPSAVFNILMSRKADITQGILPWLLYAIAILFLIVELISLIIGISMTRTITNAVHHLYEGTQRVMQGDFSQRIDVRGGDQLAELGNSFNRMTENIEQLLVVAKEKERLQSEIEIAREVQNQLYPRSVPDVRTLRLTAVCKPARMVSGDYFDYECVNGSQVALAIGDVAGKGISAALLMATLQSSLRTELRGGSLEMAAGAGNGSRAATVSTSRLVSILNQQLYAYTAPEKYATFYLGIYDEPEGLLTYTNAGHLPPILVRDGEATRLSVDGTVVGAFPMSIYEESRLATRPGDLLVCFTDGVTEPENEYGEMFGEDRLIELVTRDAHRTEDQIIASILDAVEQWTGSPELQDDMTLLLARRY